MVVLTGDREAWSAVALRAAIFTGEDLLGFLGKLLVARQSFLEISEIVLKGAVGILLGERGQAVTVKKAEIIEVAASSEAILRDDDVPLSIAGFIEKRRNKASRIGATHKHHARPKRAEHGVAIVEELLRGPIMGGFGDTEGLEDRFFRCWSRWRDVRSAACRAEWQPVARVSRAAGKCCRIMALVARRDTFSTFGAAAAQKPAGTPDTSTTPRGPRTETR